jgi:AraC-like DNA-binding protein
LNQKNASNWNTPMVASGEALRLKMYLSAHNYPLPRIFQQVAKTLEEAAESRVSGKILIDAIEAAMRALLRPSLPIEFGSTIRTADMGIYGIAIHTARTVMDALTRSVRFQRLMTTSARIYLDSSNTSVRWLWNSSELRTLGVRVRNEIVLAEHVAVMRSTVQSVRPLRVSFAHARPADYSAHDRYFNCPIDWLANEDSVTWSLNDMGRPLGVDATVSEFIEREAERRLNLLPREGTVELVRDTIVHRLSSGNVELASIAASIGRQPRALRRELVAYGEPYRNLLDNVRRQRAAEMAAEGKYSMTHIALSIGFSEVSAFSRAWRRWFNQSFTANTNSLATNHETQTGLGS